MAEAGGYIDVVLPTYRTDPEENDRFYPSVAKAIADKVLETELRFVLSLLLSRFSLLLSILSITLYILSITLSIISITLYILSSTLYYIYYLLYCYATNTSTNTSTNTNTTTNTNTISY